MSVSLTAEQTSMLTGSLLGDGCLFRYKPTHKPYFTIVRTMQDRSYLHWHFEKFQEHIIGNISDYETHDKRTGKTYYGCKFITKRSEVFTSIYEKWYPEKVKIVPQDIELDPISLAVWFMDDGSVSISNNRLRLKLSSHGFSTIDNKWLCEILSQRYKEAFSIGIDKEKTFLLASDNATRAFVSEIDSFIPDCMSRKRTWLNITLAETKSFTNLSTRFVGQNLFENELKVLALLNSKAQNHSVVKRLTRYGWIARYGLHNHVKIRLNELGCIAKQTGIIPLGSQL